MTAEDFRRIALSFPDAAESAHMNHPDFRVKGKVFATLGYPEEGWAMVKLPPAQQEEFVELQPSAFSPVKGGWGMQGATNVRLKAVKEDALRGALTIAWQTASQKKSTKR
jgi:hypothetical protein